MKKEFIKRMLKNSFISIIIIYILISGIYKANLIISTYNIINEFYNMSETEKINMKDKYIEEFNSNPKNIIHYNPICSFTKILINSMKISLEISLLFGIGIGIVVPVAHLLTCTKYTISTISVFLIVSPLQTYSPVSNPSG